MEIGETIYLTTREDWRGWLVEHHKNTAEIWLIFYKKGSGKSRIPYGEAVEEALCFGWIDSTIKSIDKEKFARRFTFRRIGSHWSATNRERALKMLRAGKMTPDGLALLPEDLGAARRP